jgi:hypothetical protein
MLKNYPDSRKDNDAFDALLGVKKDNPGSEELKGISYTFSYLCKEDMQRTLPLAQKIADCGGKVVKNLSDAQYFVVYDEEEKNDLASKSIPKPESGVLMILIGDIEGKPIGEWPKKQA